MRLSRLKLNGFKSFVDPSDLVISDGLTGVVGPNGCGKSNLLEALRWVMGENRASAMRGSGMEDVVFAGAQTRPPRSFAEVVLTIDNAERLAPAGFNDADSFEVVRRITRNAGSSYKIGGKEARARDVQMLFADASTGAHSPALVRQGQIAELINAKPKARRSILEEAAGISGLYQRRHEAELKLKGTETNLARVEDVLEQLAGQLAQLARQARQAERYREIGADLRQAEGLLLYRHWHTAQEQTRKARDEAANLAAEAVSMERRAEEARARRQTQEAAMIPLREERTIAAALRQQLQQDMDQLAEKRARAAETITRLEARIEQLRRDMERETALSEDAGSTIARLAQEQAALQQQDAGAADRLHAAHAAAEQAGAFLSEREAAHARRAEELARQSALHHAAVQEQQDVQRKLDRVAAEISRREGDAAQARAALSDLSAQVARTAQALGQAEEDADRAVQDLHQAEKTRAELAVREADAAREKAALAGEAAALTAEFSALDRLLRPDAATGGRLLDLVEVTPGYEPALGAALADDLRQAEAEAGADTGWIALPVRDDMPALPEGAVPLSRFVGGPQVLARRLAQIGVVAPAEGAAMQARLATGQRLVSQAGDLWRWDGLRLSVDDAPSAAALHLQQVNRRAALQDQIDEMQRDLDACTQRHGALLAELRQCREEEQACRGAVKSADQRLAEASRADSKAEADRTRANTAVETATHALEALRAEHQTAEEELALARGRLSALGDLGQLEVQVDELRLAVEAARLTMLTRRAAESEQRRDDEARAARLRQIAQDHAMWLTRSGSAETRIAELSQRLQASETELSAARALPRDLDAEAASLDQRTAETADRHERAEHALSRAEAELQQADQAERDGERAASAARERRAVADARSDAALQAVEAAAARIEEALDCDPQTLEGTLGLGAAPLPPAATVEAEVHRLRRQRDALGAVNLRAEEDARTVREEHDGLARDRQDLADAVAQLRLAVASLNKEGRARLLDAFEEVNRNFAMLFAHLFNGGEARLVLVESDDPLDAGLEILCQPPGKKLSTLSLLSGGEQTLTAMALIFAVFLANPAPICVLDEVDAPLDDANVTRFCDLLDEMSRRTGTRFLIITHHAITMSRMDRLFGVTMAEQGVSQLVSVDLKKAEAMVA
ncbi:chromosome segregation SMC family protein [Brevirhabdus sp.]|uniref:chromosome segregation SMC family protein n=1 Tax=Brevirhabdus sp. TaxID=2004514 RepID=UPI004059252F